MVRDEVVSLLLPVPGVAVFVGVFAIPITALGAYPIVIWLLKRGSLTLGHTFAGAAMLGTIPGLLGDLLAVRRLAERSD